MADVSVNESELSPEDQETIYDRIVEQTKLRYDEDKHMSVTAYKFEVCQWYMKEFPEDKDFENPDNVDEDIQSLINDTTAILHSNKGARTKQPLPVWEGLADPEDVSNAKPKRQRRTASADGEAAEKKPRKAKEPVEPKLRAPNRYLRAARVLIKNPKLSRDEVATEIDSSVIAAGYCIDAFEACHTAFKEAGLLVEQQ